ncbi:MAG: hypothetical protein B2I17_06075 [Thermoplasmatales archaeon B_DKE]|nr:MAG: hypothetical protein B2I17_06075 [Thermoplasmatales archaeon B_DKE]QRF75739.1 hypothetical protein Thermo_01245 [Thermoplasmatales archaeon]
MGNRRITRKLSPGERPYSVIKGDILWCTCVCNNDQAGKGKGDVHVPWIDSHDPAYHEEAGQGSVSYRKIRKQVRKNRMKYVIL